ncbi:6878_t:CDS:10 [Entrophospora sp. SA101]|nr:6878_t:CDS:10 [Entrophospora sp. SA101]
MPTRLKKNRKKRGHVSAGHGRIGKHRKHPGGRGLAGGLHHHRTNMDKYHPGYYGKVGMRHFHMTRNQYYCPTVNLDKLWTLVSEQTRKIYATKKDSNIVPVIDTLRAGYGKVLGKGRLPDQPVIIKARYVSRRAEEKIKKVGAIKNIVSPITILSINRKYAVSAAISPITVTKSKTGLFQLKSQNQTWNNIKKKWSGVKQDLIELLAKRYSWGYPLKSKSLIEVAANLFDLFTAFGALTILQSDNGKEFNSQYEYFYFYNTPDCLVFGIEPRSNDTVLELLFADCSKNAFEFLDIIIASTSGGVIYNNNDDAVNVDTNDEASDGTIASTSSGVSNNNDGGDDEIIASVSGGVSNNNNNDDENIIASTDVVVNSSSSNNREDGEYLYIELESLDELNTSQNDDYDFDELNSNLP